MSLDHATMKTYRLMIAIGAAAGIAWLVTAAGLSAHRPETGCGDGTWPHSNGHVVLASKVVVQPWYGRHHVYAIFKIPDRYSDAAYSATLSVRGVEVASALSLTSLDVHGEIIVTEPGYHLKHGHLQTRSAMWSFLTGHFRNLRAPCNWALVFNPIAGGHGRGQNKQPAGGARTTEDEPQRSVSSDCISVPFDTTAAERR
jgi:hypothetical protein